MLWESEAKRIILPGVSKRGFTECQIAVQAVKDECVCILVCVNIFLEHVLMQFVFVT